MGHKNEPSKGALQARVLEVGRCPLAKARALGKARKGVAKRRLR